MLRDFLQGSTLNTAGLVSPNLRRDDAAFRDRHPIVSGAANLAGALTLGKLALPVKLGATLLGRAAVGGGAGAVASGAEGEGSLSDRAKRALAGGGLGAAAGGVLPGVGLYLRTGRILHIRARRVL